MGIFQVHSLELTQQLLASTMATDTRQTVRPLSTIAECTGCRPPCPTVSVSCPADVDLGAPITFTASVNGDANVTYNWSVSAGTISGGQGTSSITVNTDGLGGQTVTATVEAGRTRSFLLKDSLVQHVSQAGKSNTGEVLTSMATSNSMMRKPVSTTMPSNCRTSRVHRATSLPTELARVKHRHEPIAPRTTWLTRAYRRREANTASLTSNLVESVEPPEHLHPRVQVHGVDDQGVARSWR